MMNYGIYPYGGHLMSFFWDQWYAVLLDGWNAPEGYWVCAEEPQYERRQAESIERFNSVEYLSKGEYDVAERGKEMTVTYEPDGKRYQGYVRQKLL
jgi:hypothetical protein